MFKSQYLLYNDKVLLVLTHHTDFLFLWFQSVSKVINITSTFCSLTVPVFTNVMDGLGRDVRWIHFEQINNGFIRNDNY